MAQLRVEAEGVAQAAPEAVWELVANADRYSEWGPWSASGYENLGGQAPDGAGVIRWMRYGRTTTVEKVLESERARRLVYTVVKGILVRNYRAEVTLSPVGKARTSAGQPAGTGLFPAGSCTALCAPSIPTSSAAWSPPPSGMPCPPSHDRCRR